MAIVGGTATKTDTAALWDSGFYSKEGFVGGCYVSFEAAATNKALMVGFNTDPATNSSYTSIDFAIYLRGDATVEIYESSVSKGTFGTYAAGDVFSATYNGSVVRYLKNGVMFKEVAAYVTSPLYVDSSFNTVGGSVKNVQFGPMTTEAKTYRVSSTGGSATSNGGLPTGFYLQGSTTAFSAGSRSYRVVKIDRSTGAPTLVGTYDVYGSSANATTMAAALNALTNAYVVCVYTADEPKGNRLTNGLDTAMYRCGASHAVFGSMDFKYRSAYVLIGIPGCGEGNGAEFYQGSVDSDTNAWVDASFSIKNGSLVGVSGAYTPKSLRDYGYTGSTDATTNRADELVTADINTAATKADWDKLSGTVPSNVDNANVKVGGRNLLKYASIGGSPATDYYGGSDARHLMLLSGTSWWIQNWTTREVGKYSISFWIKTSVPAMVALDIGDAFSRVINATTSWQFFSYEDFYVNAYLDTPYFGFVGFTMYADGDLTLGNIKLEFGTKATAWSPAPEDTTNAIAAKLSKAGDTITGPLDFSAPVGIYSGTLDGNGSLSDGIYLGSSGIVGRKAGATNFHIDPSGNAIFSGSLYGANITGATGEFGGSLTAGVIDLTEVNGIVQSYPNPGTYSVYTLPYVGTVRFTLVGGGGGGCAGARQIAGGPGAAGSVVTMTVTNIPIDTVVSVTVGNGGVGGWITSSYTATPGTSGWATTITIGGSSYSASGGAGGIAYSSLSVPNGTTIRYHCGDYGDAAWLQSASGYAAAYAGSSGGSRGGLALGIEIPFRGAAGNPAALNGGDGVRGGSGGGGAPSSAWVDNRGFYQDPVDGDGGDGLPTTKGGNGGAGFAFIEIFNPNSVVLRGEFDAVLLRLDAHGI